MTLSEIFNENSILKRYYFKTLIVIGFIWTLFDYSRFLALSLIEEGETYPFAETSQGVFILMFVIGKKINDLIYIFNAIYVKVIYNGGFPCICLWNDQSFELVFSCLYGDWQGSFDRS